MTQQDINLLKEHGWQVQCESPLEIAHVDGSSTATGEGAELVLEHLRSSIGTLPDVDDSEESEDTIYRSQLDL